MVVGEGAGDAGVASAPGGDGGGGGDVGWVLEEMREVSPAVFDRCDERAWRGAAGLWTRM